MRVSLLFLLASALSAQVQLSVTDGYASRHRNPGETAHVWAQQNTATRVFAGWTGDTQYLLDPAAPYTTLLLPAANVSLRATYRSVPAWTHRTETLGGIPVTFFLPANPLGLVFLFHGTGGSGLGQFTGSEFQSLTRDLVAAGFGVAAFDCLNRSTGQWDTQTTGPTNPDVVRVNTVITALRAQGLIPAELPLFAFGHSNGGQFSHFSAQVLPWRAVYISCVQGSLPASNSYTGPTAWWMGKNDDHPQVGPTGVATSLTRFTNHANRGLYARHVITGAMPLFPERIARSPFVTLADSQEIYNIFKSRGWLDSNDFLLRNPNEDYWRSAMPARFTDGQRLAIQGQLEGTNAGHEFQNFTPHLIIELYLRALGRVPALRPLNAASYSSAAVAPESIATVFTQGLADSLAVATAPNQNNLREARAFFRSAAGPELPAPWFYVSPGQASFLVPAGLAPGAATLRIESGDRRWSIPVTIAVASPGIFTAAGNGQGAPAAILLRVAPDNSRSTGFATTPIRFGDDRLFLDLYATGVRGVSNATVEIAGQLLTPLYAGPQPQFAGLDQVTFELPRSLAGRGRLEVTLVLGNLRSNPVELTFP